MRKWIFLVAMVLAALLVRPSVAEEPPAAPPPIAPETPAERAVRTLREDLDRIFAEAGLPDTIIAARVVALGAGREGREVLYSVRADQPLVPASTTKLVTTAACWERLGPDWRIGRASATLRLKRRAPRRTSRSSAAATRTSPGGSGTTIPSAPSAGGPRS